MPFTVDWSQEDWSDTALSQITPGEWEAIREKMNQVTDEEQAALEARLSEIIQGADAAKRRRDLFLFAARLVKGLVL